MLDHGLGDVRPTARALEAAGAHVELTTDARAAGDADGLVVAGAGALAAVLGRLREVRGDQVVDRRLAGGRAVLGTGVGMHVLFDAVDEDGVRTEGLGEWPGVVEPVSGAAVGGWATVEPPEASVLFAGVEGERFWFEHTSAARRFPLTEGSAEERLAPPRVTWAEHGDRFVAAVENGPLSATQFAPERSGDAGARLLTNWVRSLR